MLEYLLIAIGILMNLVTLLIIIKIALPNKKPMDESNRINHIRLVWFALTRPELFVNSFDWLTHDELDNVRTKND